MLLTDDLERRLRGIFNEVDNVKLSTKLYMDALGDGYCKLNKDLPPVVYRDAEGLGKSASWWKEEVKRCMFGWGNFSGMGYGYARFGCMPNGDRVVFRRCDEEFFQLVEGCLYGRSSWFGDMRLDSGKVPGIYVLGRRRCGKSQKLGWASMMVAFSGRACNVGLMSKELNDANKLLAEKVYSMYDQMPLIGLEGYSFFPGNSAGRSANRVVFAKKDRDEYRGGTITSGLNSIIEARSSEKTTIWEGFTGRMLIFDEFPKTRNGLTTLRMSLPCLNDRINGSLRTGLGIVCGVAGEFDNTGDHAVTLWRKDYAIYDFLRYFIAGWESSDYMDEYGNEDVERAVFDIMTERARLVKLGAAESLRDYLQQYPLTPDEALLSVDSEVLPTRKIYAQVNRVESHGSGLVRRGNLRWVRAWESAEFVPDTLNGKVELLELPNRGAENLYFGGIDSYGLREKTEGSKGALFIWKSPILLSDYERENIDLEMELAKTDYAMGNLNDSELLRKLSMLQLKEGNMPILRYVDSPKNPDEFSEVCAMALMMYRAKALIERKPETVIQFFSNNNLRHLMLTKPVRSSRFVALQKADFSEFGISYDDTWAGHRLDALYRYCMNHSEKIYFVDFLRNLAMYDPQVRTRKFDDVDAAGTVLIAMADVKQDRVIGKGIQLSDGSDNSTGKVNRAYPLAGVLGRLYG